MWWAWNDKGPKPLRAAGRCANNHLEKGMEEAGQGFHHAKMRLESCHVNILSLLRFQPSENKKKKVISCPKVHQKNWKK